MIAIYDLQAEAYRLGFFLAGVTTPTPPPHINIFEDWLAKGCHGEMSYLASERSRTLRRDPILLKPDTRSILVLGFRHSHPGMTEGGGAQVAAFSVGMDYHMVMKAHLSDLAERLAGLAGRQGSWNGYSDSAPILERSLAQMAGLGWIGRNSCLIMPGVGSFFLLAEIFLNNLLQPSPEKMENRCGTCNRCIQACPTGCILPDRTIDARGCISYLTIENKGIIPMEYRKTIGSWIFGCDICQLVCPWNNRPLRDGWDCISEFKPVPGWPPVDLNHELQISIEAFTARFLDTPVSRARRPGYLRNIAVVLGNRKDPDSFPFLARSLLEEPEPLVRIHIAWALGQLQGQRSRQVLDRALKQEPDLAVIDEISLALEGYE
jgi:epoxyqueuosine reductase